MESLNEIDAEDLQVFLIEGHEILSQFEQDVLNLEKGSFDQKCINQLYRALHTIKGNCGFLPLPKLETIAHAGETLLNTIRTSQERITPEIATALLQLTDTIRQLLLTIETTKTEGTQDYSALIDTLITLSTPELATITSGSSTYSTSNGSSSTPIENSTVPQVADTGTQDAASDSTIRVSVDLLDHMMDLVSELVLVRNRVVQLMPGSDNPGLTATYRQINLITNELQDSVMRARMQPISTLWRNLPRLVRETAAACGKAVVLELAGSETELDRSLIAAIKDPLMHLVRNGVDHGIEPPQVRVASGKSAQGKLKLRALQENGKVTLEICDDGAGIDPIQMKAQAQQLGLINADQAQSLSDRQAFELIFLPGFSTATEVTHLSGRGVGMDVVRRNLETINGTIEIDSQLGYGTTFRLKIPLTLAIIPALLVSTGGERFAIPQANVQELIRIEGKEKIESSIETLVNVPVYRLRGQILPLVYLSELLQLTSSSTQDDVLYFVVLTIEDYRLGLIVDQIEDAQDIVVKPLSRQLKMLSMFAGVTILGDGKAALILDATGLAQYAGVQRQSLPYATPELEQTDRQLILIVLGPQNSRMGIRLTHATRLERIPRDYIQQVGGQYVMQYRDRIVSLVDLDWFFDGKPRALDEFEEVVPVVVVMLDEKRTVGLIVQQILDVVAESLTVTGATGRPGVQCYAMVQGQITEILDLEAITDLANLDTMPRDLITGVGR